MVNPWFTVAQKFSYW